MVKLRTTNEPLVERDVSATEAADLKALGLVLESRATTPEGLIKAAIAQVSGAAAEDEPDGGNAGDDTPED